ncbi:Aldehyde ferredoxin oxidoreductase, C-terminal [Moorella glycerini]|uniref:Oxidoreductase YdhV n=1 Tax=Neomoorella stamsii TaxID=1266720 RepID=A0A9X7J244_9FIRM|nr:MULTISPECIES: aldehyde ferredoxin oxidoreductase family protein [Moorella]PRR71511.1 putative oxidoreductase YdhV [Moorella stamsii]CEP68722.1 Aldehyde ferredoxin oxidoreductase, C-terminal [Moorella glycerini]
MNGCGYQGKILWIDLSNSLTKHIEPDKNFYRTYLGGPGLGLYYLLKFLPQNCEPLGPENILVFAPGFLTGTPVPCVPRYTVCAKSPLTGGLGKSEAGGYWGPELRKAGYDALVVVGRAAGPVYLWIADDKVEIRDASRIWGLDTGEAEAFIRQDTGVKDAKIAIIGPGGENKVLFAGIVNDLSHFNGRNGLGAVMGSKNLKAIAVCGSKKVPIHERDKIQQLSRWVSQNYREHPLSSALHEYGTPAGVESNNAGGCLPTNNWSLGVFSGANDIGGKELTEKYLVERGGCYACPIRCKRIVKVDDAEFKVDRIYGGPEYETLVALGSNCGINNLKLIIKANELCNRYTIDTISTGMAISFAMACYEQGIITKEDTGGLELKFGNEEILLSLIEQIAYRQGFGKILADGTRAVAARIGRGAEAMLLEVKGQEIPMHDPRVKTGLGLQFALAPNGADHWFAQHDPFFTSEGSLGLEALAPLGILEPIPALDLGPQKVRMVFYTSVLNSMYDCLGVCMFGAVARSLIPLNNFVDFVQATTGWETSLWELLKTGERVNTMARLFNIRQGLGCKDDTLPATFFKPIVSGPLDGKNALDKEAFEQAVKLYYGMAGWDETGIPTAGKLLELGLDQFVDNQN